MAEMGPLDDEALDNWGHEPRRMKVLVTGGAGYIGSTLVPMLLEEGYAVVIYDLFRWGMRPLLNPYLDTTHLQIINGDILDDIALTPIVKNCDAVIHLAGIVSAPAFNRYPEVAQEVNERGTKILVDSMEPSQCLIYASVENVYGKTANEVSRQCTEDAECQPLSLFAKTKVNDEQNVLKANGVVLRIPSAFGVSPRMRLDLLVNNLVFQACTKGHVSLYQADYKRNFVHIKDLSRCFVFSLKNCDEMRGKAYNVGDTSLVYTKRQVCDAIKMHLPNITVDEPSDNAYADMDKRNFVMSFDRLRNLGFEVTKTLQDGINELIKVVPFLSEEEIRRCQAL